MSKIKIVLILIVCFGLYKGYVAFTNFEIGVSITSLEILTKFFLYYFHERVWFNSSFSEAKKRHLIKTFSWRLIATMDTVIIGYIISGEPLLGLKLGFFEIISDFIISIEAGAKGDKGFSET